MATFTGLLALDIDPAELIASLIAALFAKLSAFLGAAAELLELHIIMIATVIEEVIKAIIGPLFDIIMFIVSVVLLALTAPLELLAFLLEQLAKIPAMIQKLIDLIMSILDGSIIEKVIALVLAALEPKIQFILDLLGMSFPDLLALFTMLLEFIKGVIIGIIEGIVKPLVEGMIAFLIACMGAIAMVAKLGLFAIEAVKDFIGAIMKLLGIPPFMDIVIGILTPIISVEPIMIALQKTLEPIFGLLEDIEELIMKGIKFLLMVLAGTLVLPLGILALIMLPVMVVIHLVGTILATLTPEQTLDIPLGPIPA